MKKDKNNYFENKGFQLNGIRCLSSKDAYPLLIKKAILIDMRKEYETNYRIFDVPDILYISDRQIKKNPAVLPRSTPLIFADNVGLVSKEVVTFLAKKGFTNVSMLIGGVVDWVKQGFPVKKDPNYELVGQCGCKLKPKNPKRTTNRSYSESGPHS